jgi:Rad3-related DNA helicase
MYSSSLNKFPFLEVSREYKQKNKDLYALAKAINKFFIQLRKQFGKKEFILEEMPEKLTSLAEKFVQVAEQELILSREGGEFLLETYFAVQRWIQLGNLADERFLIYGEGSDANVFLKQFCLDPSKLLQKAGKAYRARIYFSATLEPFDYYKEMIGSSEEDYYLRLPSPFAAEQSDVYIQPLSTRFHDREKSVIPIIRTMEKLAESRPGNYLVFFPSYLYMNMVAEEWRNRGREALVQTSGMVEEEREEFLGKFGPRTSGTLFGFAVLGGIFSEGIDLKGDRLNGVIIVGTGLPKLTFERNLIKCYFDDNGQNGYDYAYVYPGMSKVLQAGGRLIRSENDTGTIILIDDRFLQGKYQHMLPCEWADYQVLNFM